MALHVWVANSNYTSNYSLSEYTNHLVFLHANAYTFLLTGNFYLVDCSFQ